MAATRIEGGYFIVKNPKPHGKSYNKWLGDQAKSSHRELLRTAIDEALARKPADMPAFLKELEQSGCTVAQRGKNITLCAPGWKKPARMNSLGKGYTQEDVVAVLYGKKEYTPRKKPVSAVPATPKINLLVDIQAKLQAGKGMGYANWAKTFNLKQMAQTMMYLSEHNLMDYAVLKEKTSLATARYDALSVRIKAAENRMTEITELRTQIINHADTQEVYEAYRKADC